MNVRNIPLSVALWLAIIMLAPLPLGGNRLWAWSFIGGAFALLALIYVVKNRNIVFAAPIRIIVYLFCACICWLFIQALSGISMNPTATLNGILRWSIYGLSFLLAFQFGRDRRYARLLLRGIAIAGACYAIYGGYIYSYDSEMLFLGGKVHYINDVTGSFINRNSYATYAAIASLLSLFWIFDALKKLTLGELARISDNYFWSYILQLLNIKTLIPVFCFMLNLSGLLMSHSRAGFISFCASAIITLIIALCRNKKSHKVNIRLWLALPLVIIAGWITYIGAGDTLSRMVNIDHDWGERYELYETAGRAIAAHPLTGTGLGTFQNAYHIFREPLISAGADKRVVFAHNSYLQSISELGIPAALLLMAIFIIIFVLLLRGVWVRKKDWEYPLAGISALLVIAIHSLVDFSIAMPAITITLLSILGGAVAQSSSSRIEAKAISFNLRVAFAILSGAIIIFSIQLFMASKHLIKQEHRGSNLSRAELSEVINDNQNALLWRNLPNLHQNTAIAQTYMAQTYEEQSEDYKSHLEQAEYHLKKSAELAPHDPFIWAQLMHVAALGNQEPVIITGFLEKSFNAGMSEPRLMTYRLRIGLTLWDNLSEKQKELVIKQLPLAQHYAPEITKKILSSFPDRI